jgi:hypothetical protein
MLTNTLLILVVTSHESSAGSLWEIFVKQFQKNILNPAAWLLAAGLAAAAIE